MKPGDARDIVDIEQPQEAIGDPVPDFDGPAAYRDVPCRITNVAGSETFRGRGIEAMATHVVEMHYLPGLTETMRLNVKQGTYRGKTMNIRAVRTLQQDRGRCMATQLDCVEVRGG